MFVKVSAVGCENEETQQDFREKCDEKSANFALPGHISREKRRVAFDVPCYGWKNSEG